MANDSATAEAATAPVEATTTANGANTAAQEQAQAEEEAANGIFQITVKLPHEPHELQMTISTAEQVQDLRQSIIEMPHTFQYSCFHLEHDGKRINEATPVQVGSAVRIGTTTFELRR